MHRRWEIADVAIFVSLRRQGPLLVRKVALLQTKRLYSHELAGTELEPHDYMIGVSRLADRVDPQVPLSTQRRFRFDDQSRRRGQRNGQEGGNGSGVRCAGAGVDSLKA